MPTFKYVAVGADGVKVRATVDAVSATALRNDLTLSNMRVLRVREKRAFSEIEITKERVPRQVLMHFTRQLAAFMRAGIPITDALAVITEGTENKRFREILTDVNEELRNGLTLSRALAPHAAILPPYYLGILRSAEQTGRLDLVLDQLAAYMARDFEARQKLRSALAYPAIVGTAAIAVVILMATFVLPRLTKFFKSFGVTRPPLTTRILLGVSHFFSHFWWFTPLVLIVVATIVVLLRVTPRGRMVRDRALLRIWLVRDVVRFGLVERFCRIIGAMMRAGVPLPDAMRAAIDSVNNGVFAEQLEAVNLEILAGEGMAGPIGATSMFPNAAVQMMRVGEQTGTLDHQLDIAAEYYGAELEFKLSKLTAMFEPAVIVGMGLIVGFVAVTMVQSIYGMIHAAHLTGGAR